MLLQSSLRPVPAQVILLWKRLQNFPSDATWYPQGSTWGFFIWRESQ